MEGGTEGGRCQEEPGNNREWKKSKVKGNECMCSHIISERGTFFADPGTSPPRPLVYGGLPAL